MVASSLLMLFGGYDYGDPSRCKWDDPTTKKCKKSLGSFQPSEIEVYNMK